MNYEEKISYIKALMYIATADEKVDEEELSYFNRVGQLYGISEEELESIKQSILNKSESIEDILGVIKSRDTKLLLVYELVALCFADGKYEIVEKQGIQNICGILGIEDEKLKEIEDVILENIELQNKINVILERV